MNTKKFNGNTDCNQIPEHMIPSKLEEYFNQYFNIVKFDEKLELRIKKTKKIYSKLGKKFRILSVKVYKATNIFFWLIISVIFGYQHLFRETKPQKKTSVLFFSHCTKINSSLAADQFFGEIINSLCMDESITTIYTNQAKGGYLKNRALLKKHKTHNSYLIPKFLSLSDTFEYIKFIKFTYVSEVQNLKATQISDEFAINYEKIKGIFGRESYNNYRIYNNYRKFLKTTKVKFSFTLLEGWPYEYIISTTNTKFNVKNFFYQHSAILPTQFGLNKRLQNISQDDIILTSGKKFNKYFLQENPNLHVITIGTSRNISRLYSATQKKDRILFCPEATNQEVNVFINFLRDCQNKNVDYELILRLHPNYRVPIKIRLKILKLKRRLKNFSVSKSGINLDLSASKFIVYRGSTLVYQALGAGCVPIHLRIPEVYSNDSLAELGMNELWVEKFSDLHKVILEAKNFNSIREKVFEDLNLQILNKFFK